MYYFPMVSEACEKAGIPYLAWIYDNPYTKAYSVSIVHSCNYIFTFDSAMYEELASQGVTTVYYALMAANPDRIATMKSIPSKYTHDISFFGAIYNEEHNFYEEFVKNAVVGKYHNFGYAVYKSEMLLIFQDSKINLNISLKNIKNSIPLRTIEIMGAAGFLLCNFQSDFLLHFDSDVDFVYHENLDDAVEKAAYYLQHESERVQIAANGLQKIKEYHTYEIRLSQMIATLKGDLPTDQ